MQDELQGSAELFNMHSQVKSELYIKRREPGILFISSLFKLAIMT